MCPRCLGFLIRDLGFQHDTHNGVAYHCVNCGNYLDYEILRNRRLSAKEREANAHKRLAKYSMGDDSYSVLGISGLFLGSDTVLDIV